MVQTPSTLFSKLSSKVSSKLTLEDFLKLPETKPAREYIDGEILQKPMPQGKHSIIQTELASALGLSVEF